MLMTKLYIFHKLDKHPKDLLKNLGQTKWNFEEMQKHLVNSTFNDDFSIR